MTRPELHALVDIVMDAREKGVGLTMNVLPELVNVYNSEIDYCDYDYPTFSDFTKAVKEYIKTLEK